MGYTQTHIGRMSFGVKNGLNGPGGATSESAALPRGGLPQVKRFDMDKTQAVYRPNLLERL